MRSLGWTLIQCAGCAYKRKFVHRHAWAQRKGHGKAQGEEGTLQAKERGLGKKQPCWHLDSGLVASGDVRRYISAVWALSVSSVMAARADDTRTPEWCMAYGLPLQDESRRGTVGHSGLRPVPRGFSGKLEGGRVTKEFIFQCLPAPGSRWSGSARGR